MKEIIRKIDVFSGLDEKLLTRLADTAITCTYSANEVVIREGELGIGMYFILSGKVAVVRNHVAGEMRLAEIEAEHFFAEMALVDDKPRSASVVTVEATECLLFTRDTFLRLMEKHPTLSIRLARVLAERLRRAQEKPAAPEARTAPAAETAVAAAPAEAGMKANIQKQLLEAFEMLYTLKAFTRFSVAILGCPVEATAANALETIRVGEVKAVILPAGEEVRLGIAAHGAGQFELHVFAPGRTKALRFEPQPIEPDDRFTLHLPEAVLRREEARA
jgi:CRP-like cAMP-binding protein